MATAASAAASAGVVQRPRSCSPSPLPLRETDILRRLGIDGNWSSVAFLLGTESDSVNILPSTSLSELWAVGPGGCQNKEQHCMSARGGIYTPTDSKRWTSWGQYFLGLDYLGYGGNGAYGRDNINSWSPITNIAFGMSNVLIAAYNTTDYFNGLFGLGISQGRFKTNIGESALTQAVKEFGWIPSYSYGYTAGASYRNMPLSLTLGGYDSARFVEHDTLFTITQSDNSPRVNVRGISVYNDHKPSAWSSSTNVLSDYDDRFTGLVDSTTPYLWLPAKICESFATALNLTYNETFKLYTLTNQQYQDYSTSDAYSFTFSLSSIDNLDNFGLPLSAPGVVNITIPIKTFIGSLSYPFAKEAIKYGQPGVPYFMLRKATNSSEVIIGRSFLQETYIRTKYDSGVFSIHQASFPKDPNKDAKLVHITQPGNSPYPPPPPNKAHHHGLATAQMIGIAVGVVAFCTLLFAGLWFWCRRRKQNKRGEVATKEDEAQDTSSTIAPDSPMTPVSRILSKIVRRKRSRRATTATTASAPMEAPASEIYELPAPLPPAELAAHHEDDDSMLGDTEAGTDDSQNLSAYELARRKLARQLAGPVPAYAPPENGVMPIEKDMEIETNAIQTTTIPHPQPTYHHHNISPVRSHEGLGTNSLPGTLPSPVSPRTDWNTNDLPSPITASLHPNSASSQSGSTGRRRGGSNTMGTVSESSSASRSNSNSSSNSNDQHQSRENKVTFPLPQASFQRTPIEPSKVVCLGPLPENVNLFRQRMLPGGTGTTGQSSTGPTGPINNSHHRPSTGSLGSNYTDDEDAMMEEMTRQSVISASRTQGSQSGSRPTFTNPLIRTVLPPRTEEEENVSPTSDRSGSGSHSSGGRIDGDDLIHVPQMAEKRYSWEEER
ncbi:hypothetical protein NLG97_g8358 [Lecanicillium saksenae]|uniref:Uncharacterized protein n=1 Tax=Lecanicillium saksenae TaxID=468837 RepID=A0ACC1QJ82_9HYPO|nr:hypothetical protein NLG97_g8358 [Lecanicillium saksenae]